MSGLEPMYVVASTRAGEKCPRGDSNTCITHPCVRWVLMWQFYRRPLWISNGSRAGHINCVATDFTVRCLWRRVDDRPLGKLCPRVTSLVVLLRLPCKAFGAGSADLPCGPTGWSGMGRGGGVLCGAAWSMAIVGLNCLMLRRMRPDAVLDGYLRVARTCASDLGSSSRSDTAAFRGLASSSKVRERGAWYVAWVACL